MEAKLILDPTAHPHPVNRDPALIKAVARAYDWNRRLIDRKAKSIRDLARDEGVSNRYIRKLLPLAFLSPDIVEAILQGRQPRHLSLETLAYADVPYQWDDQRGKFGYLAS